jgi:hypothetical protein
VTLLAQLAAMRTPRRSVGRVTALADDVDERSCTVDVGGGSITAYWVQHTADVALGDVVTVVPVGDTFEVAAIHTAAGGSSGPLLGQNLLVNASMELGVVGEHPDGWTAQWDTAAQPLDPLALVDDVAARGSRSARVTALAGAPHDVTVATEHPVEVDEQVTYRLGAWVRASGSTAGHTVSLEAYTGPVEDHPDAAHLIAVSVTTLPDVFQFLFGTVTVPAGHRWARIVLRSVEPVGADLQVWWDELSLRELISTA